MMEASHFDVNTAYASVDRHQLQDFDPYIYRTRDMGKTWQRISDGLPKGVYVHTVKEDPMRRGLLVAGTERGAFVSFDDGGHWQPLQLNLPVTSVRDFQFYGGDLIVATHGRGFWVIDDISPLREIGDQLANVDAYLFKPAQAIAVMQGGGNATPYQKDEPQAEPAPDGAILYYYLKTKSTQPVTLEILDASGKTLDTLSSAPGAERPPAGRRGVPPGGIPRTTALWRVPPAPFSADAGMHRVVWRPRGRRGGIFGAPPQLEVGDYTAKLTVNGKTYTQPFTVKPDPRAAEEEIKAR